MNHAEIVRLMDRITNEHPTWEMRIYDAGRDIPTNLSYIAMIFQGRRSTMTFWDDGDYELFTAWLEDETGANR